MSDAPTPEEIENISFPESQHGYDRARVDAFLRTIAQEMRRMQRDFELACERSEAPYRAAGKEIGELMQRAKELSRDLVKEAEHQTTRALQDAHKESRRLTQEAAGAEQEARRAAERMLSKARAKAADLVERARRVKARAEAEARIVLQEAERDGRLIRQEAKAVAARLRDEVERDATEQVERLARRIQALKEAEATLRQRVEALRSRTDLVAAEPANHLERSAGVINPNSESG